VGKVSVRNPVTKLVALRHVPIFGRLAKATLFELARRTNEVAYPAGATLVREGDPGDALCIIASGTVEVHKHGRVVAKMTAGEFFGEISLIDGEPRSATVVAADDVVLYTLSSSDFDALLNVPYVARAVLKSLAKRVREAHGPAEGPAEGWAAGSKAE
jgi:CRP-like cAMP-binding protein